ncbi:hypothetical protein Tco_0435699 [Tanacetum coccineum]
MSDLEDSTVTYTEVSSPFEDLSDIGSPRVDGLPMMPEDPYAYVKAALQAPPSPDYVPDPEHPSSPVYVSYVPDPVYPEFMPPEDDVLPAEEQPLPAAVLPTADSPSYITESDPEEEKESSGDDADNEEEDEDEDEEEGKEHIASADSVSPPIPSPPLPILPPLLVSPPPLPASPTYPLRYRAAMIRASVRAAAPSTYILAPRSKILPSETPPPGTPPLLPIPLPTPSPPLLLPFTVCRASVSKVTLPPRKRLCIALGPRFKVGKSSSAPTARPTRGFRANYGFVSTLDDEIRRDPERKDTDEIYERLDYARDDRSLMSGQLNMLCKDRRAHARTARLMENEAILSCEASVQSMDASNTARFEARALWTTVLPQQTEIGELRAADRRRQTQLTEVLTLIRTLQTQVTALQSQQGPASDPTRPKTPEQAGSSS